MSTHLKLPLVLLAALAMALMWVMPATAGPTPPTLRPDPPVQADSRH
jgi:hypothetical protein